VAGTDLVTPNLYEALALLGTGSGEPVVVELAADARHRATAAAKQLVARGAVAALVTAGAAGAALCTRAGDQSDKMRWVSAPPVAVRNPIGAGDAFVAGLAAALERDAPLERAAVEATAVAAASVETLLPGIVDAARARELIEQVGVDDLAT
jgi:sugar/nucleoside kinase (ribokinase family)